MKRFLVSLVVVVLTAPAFTGAGAASEQSSADELAKQARAALSQIDGRIELQGLSKPVEVIRDPWGVAHIYAETSDDLFFAQGFVAAQDRLWQMEIWRRTGEGKLAEILGPSAIERDKFARLMRYRGDMDAEWKSYAPDAKRIIESFVGGVNAFIEISRDRLPIEFQLTGIKPEPWTPETCLTRMAGYVMTRNASSEVQRAQLVRMLGTAKTDELLETDPPKKLEVPVGLDLDGIDSKILTGASAASGSVRFDSGEGSNNWVVSGALTATGKPILANDPHRSIALPSLRYLVHLVGPGWNVIGAGEPALPGVAAGHNERVGFGFTIVGIDQQDLFVEETSPDDPTLYRYQGKWERMRVEREQIRIKGKREPVEVELRFTRHGPVIHEDRARHRAYALRWVGSEPGSAGYLASLALDRARNWKEFLAALERWKVPSENLVYADVDGSIGWQAAGLAPLRRGWSGLLPVPGNSGKYEWSGFLPLSELPRAYNPSKQFIATANHNILPPGYKHEIGFDWAAPFRFHRIEEVLKSRRGFTVADFQRLQHDELSLPARELVPLLKGIKVGDGPTREAIELLLGWDFVLSKDSAAAALYEVWLTKLSPSVFKPAVPPEASRLAGGRQSLERLIATLKNPDSRVFGSVPNAARDAALLKSLEEAIAELRSRLGSDPARWRWRDLHAAEFKHALSTDASRRAVFDLKSVTRGGDGNTVNATGGASFRQSSGASFREILDLSDWDNSVAINVPGQSGQPTSPHYGDLLPLWADGKYFPLLFSRDKVVKHAAHRLVLEPRNKP
ncbi:MAG TPA: penicillin acylase family protein [Blastocatellia bacterium]|nr:penicillin acylase family protein [Blastocatellia bacterium]